MLDYGHAFGGQVSIDQLFLTNALAIWTIMNCFFFMREPVFKHVKKIQRGYVLEPNLPIRKYFIFATIGSCVAIMIGLAAYYIHMGAFDPDPMWI